MVSRPSRHAAWRVVTLVMAATLGAIAVTQAQAEPEGWAACAGELPQYSIDQQIAGCTAALAVNPNDHNALFNRAHSFEAKGQFDQAISDYNRTIALKPDYATAYEARANSYYFMRQYEWAIADYTQSISRMPANAEPYGNRGNAYLAMARYDKAIADYTKALKLDPTNQSALSGLPLARAGKAGLRWASAQQHHLNIPMALIGMAAMSGELVLQDHHVARLPGEGDLATLQFIVDRHIFVVGE